MREDGELILTKKKFLNGNKWNEKGLDCCFGWK